MVTIVIPAYNVEKYISSCLDNCLSQTYQDIEILVINDGSKDSTAAIVDKYVENHPNIILVNKPNGGLVSARKESIERAKGEYIFFLDADDIINQNAIELLVENSAGADIVVGDFVLENENGKKLPIQHENKKKYEGDDKISTYCNYLSKSITASLCGRLIRTEFLKDFKTPLSITTGEDVITNLIIVKEHSPKIVIVNSPLYHYIQHPQSMINTKNHYTLSKRVEYSSWVMDFFTTEGLTEDSLINKALSRHTLEECYSLLRDGGSYKEWQPYITKVFSDFWRKDTIGEMSVWKRVLLKSYRVHYLLGNVVRYMLNRIRKIVKS